MQNKELQQQYADLLPAGANPATVQVVGDLHAMYATAPAPAHINTAIARAVQQRSLEQAQRPAQPRMVFGGFVGWQLRTVGVVAALLLAFVAGGAYALAPVLNRAFDLVQETDPGLQYVRDNKVYEEIDLSRTIDGYTIHVQRVYADANRVVVGYTISGPENKDNLEGYGFDVENTAITTASGVVLPWYGGGGAALEGSSQSATQANVLMFDAAAVQGNPAELNLRLDITEVQVYITDAPAPLPGQVGGPAKIVSGPFSFIFTVPFHGGQVVAVDQTIVVDAAPVQATHPLNSGDVEVIDSVATQPVAVTLERVVVSPSETRAYLRLPVVEEVAFEYVSLSPIFSGNGWTSEDFTTIIPSWTRPEGWTGDGSNTMISRTTADGQHVLILPTPLHEKHGEWTISIPNISGTDQATKLPDGTIGTKTITGPWEFKFIVP